MPLSNLWNKAKGALNRAQDEIVKVSQIGRIRMNRSFLTQERNKIFQRLGEISYDLILEKKIEYPDLNRLVEHITRMNRKIEEIELKLKELTRSLSVRLDADENSDISIRIRKRRSKIEVSSE